MPIAPSVPMTAANALLAAPRSRLLRSASISAASRSSASYQRHEKPVHETGSLASLNENTITTAIGR